MTINVFTEDAESATPAALPAGWNGFGNAPIGLSGTGATNGVGGSQGLRIEADYTTGGIFQGMDNIFASPIPVGTPLANISLTAEIRSSDAAGLIEFRLEARDSGGTQIGRANFNPVVSDTYATYGGTLDTAAPDSSGYYGGAIDFSDPSIAELDIVFVITKFGMGEDANFLDIDNVSLDYTPVPEPSTLCLFGFAVVGLSAFRRKR